eukprot:1156385-Prorocentrum_minimum.AAC.1
MWPSSGEGRRSMSLAGACLSRPPLWPGRGLGGGQEGVRRGSGACRSQVHVFPARHSGPGGGQEGIYRSSLDA